MVPVGIYFIILCYIRSSSARVRSGQVNKTLEIIGLEFYCGTLQGPLDLTTMDNARSKGNKCDTILAPSDVSMSILVCKPGNNFSFVACC